MKKYLMIIVVFFMIVLFLSGCGKPTIVGKWSYSSYVYTFNKDNTCTYDAVGTILKCTYTVDGDKLSILYDGNTAPYETTFKIEDNTLHIIDSFGSDISYERQ